MAFDKRLLAPGFGKTFTKGKARILSGLPLGPKTKPLKVRFRKAGLFTYYCNIHPGMKGTVRVRPKSRAIPSKKADARRVKRQVAKALAVAKSLAKNTKPAANTVSVGAQGKGGVHFFGMVPNKLTVTVGTTVNFTSPTRSTDIHTATFGPGDAEKKATYIGSIAASFESPAPDARGVYPSQAPGTPPAALSPALHRNGFWNSGAMGAPGGPLPASGRVTFATPGSYAFVCVIHPFMKGTITVQ